jgi:predicted lysophospholipase L1 biosynthesis ABC-type transport system permease subunit
VANLMLARGAARQREIALRFSLGASRARLVRQSLTESLLLGAAGSWLGVAFAYWGQRTILRFLPADSSDALAATPNATVLAFTLAVSAISALLFGLPPALASTANNPAARFLWGARLSQRGAGPPRALVVVQVAFSVVLVALAALFGHSLLCVARRGPGLSQSKRICFQLRFSG